MKRERRHELQHNDLAEWSLKTYERIVPYKNAILGVSLLLFVLVIAGLLWHSHSVSQAGEAWNSLGIPLFQPQFANEQTISQMEKAAQTYPDTAASEWAKVFAADAALMCGTNRILTEKTAGTKFLEDAQKRYTEALTTLTIPGAKEQAMFGKARAMESLIQNKDQLDESVAAYKELVDKFPNGIFKAIADQRIEQLQKKDALEFYRALALYTPKPKPESSGSRPGSPGGLLENPPDEPLVPTPPVRKDATQPGPLGALAPSLTPLEPVRPTTPKTETPKTDATKPDTTKPDTTKPDTTKPPAKTEPPKSEAAKSETAKATTPKSEAPKAETPKPEATKAEPPKPEPPKPEVPKKDK
jgi:hypothetical protein